MNQPPPNNRLHGLPATDPVDGRPLNWGVHPGGVPVRQGDSPSLVDRALLARAGSTVHSRSEVMKIPGDLAKYVEITDWIAKLNARGAAVLRFEERIPDREKPGEWHVWLSWIELRGTIPTDPRAGMR